MCVLDDRAPGANLGWDMILVPDACDCFDLPDGVGGTIRAEEVQRAPRRDPRLRVLPNALDRRAAEAARALHNPRPRRGRVTPSFRRKIPIGAALPMNVTTLPKPPRVGLVSLGCPKALVDSERIMTKLRADGYDMSPDYAGADVVLVNTCGFLDSAKEESLEAIGEAIAENGRVVVTGCMGKEADVIRARFPRSARGHRPAAI